MIKLILIFAAALFLARRSELYTDRVLASGGAYRARRDTAFVLLLVLLTLFTGLRTSYNDTANYIRGFNNAPLLQEFFSEPENLNIFKNPLFAFIQSGLHTLGADAQIMIFLTSLFTQLCFLLFFKRWSQHFTLAVFIYFTLGTFCFTMAAMKQVVAMAVLTLAIPFLEKKKWLQYYLLVFVAMLLHTYAMAFAVLPLFARRPWRLFTFAFVAFMAVIMLNFEEAITGFMEQANELGKTLAEYEIFDDQRINALRLAVYAVLPVMSFVFQRQLFRDADRMNMLFVHMSILSLAFMTMGTRTGANMFGRMGNYFELGTICSLPWMLERIFEKRSCRLVTGVAILCFLVFFVYAFGINHSFDAEYRMIW